MKKYYKPIILAAVAITGLWLLRCLLAGSINYYGFITGNILLATIPLLLEPAFQFVQTHVRGLLARVSKSLLAVVWLLFIPNAFYILTDFMHLNSDVLVNVRGNNYRHAVEYMRGDGLYMIDSLLVFAATLYGAFVGGLALLHAYRYVQKRFSSLVARLAITGVIILSAVGIYIGRYGRWNSWEGLIQPWAIAHDLVVSLSISSTLRTFLLVIGSAILFQISTLVVMHKIERV